jgi:hypothetical protein
MWYNPKDIVDQTLEQALSKSGLIDWTWILEDLKRKKVDIKKKELYRRVKKILRSRAQEPWLWDIKK